MGDINSDSRRPCIQQPRIRWCQHERVDARLVDEVLDPAKALLVGRHADTAAEQKRGEYLMTNMSKA